MADLSRVLQALGAVSSGVGNTILSIEEQKRRAEEEEERRRFREMQANIQRAQLAAQGVTLPDEEGTVAGVLGVERQPDVSAVAGGGVAVPQVDNRIGQRVDPRNLPESDPRMSLGDSGSVFDPRAKAQRDQQVNIEAERIQRERARTETLPIIQGHESYQNLSEDEQERIDLMVLNGDLPDTMQALDFLRKTSADQQKDVANRIAFERLNARREERGLPVFEQYDPETNYQGIREQVIATEMTRQDPRVDTGVELSRLERSVVGDAISIIRQQGATPQIVLEQLRQKYGDKFTDGELVIFIDQAARTTLSKRATDLTTQTMEGPSPLEQFRGSSKESRGMTISGTPPGGASTGGSRALDLVGGNR